MGNSCMWIKEEKSKEEIQILPTIKIIVVGENVSGKTSVIERFANDRFVDDYTPTLELNITSDVKKVLVPEIGLTRLELWDVPAHEKVDVRQSYYVDADGVVVVTDVNEEDFFENALYWKHDVEKNYNRTKKENFKKKNKSDTSQVSLTNNKRMMEKTNFFSNPPILLVGNKFDLLKKMKFNDSEKSNTEDSKSLKEETKEEDLRSHEEDHQEDEKMLMSFMEKFELFIEEKNFTSGVLVSAALPSGGVKESFQYLIRRILENNDSQDSDFFKYRKKENLSSNRLGIDEVDDVIDRIASAVNDAESITHQFVTSLHQFKLACSQSGEFESIESCVEWIKMMVEKVESHKKLHLSMIENEFLLLQIKDSDEELVEDQIFPDRLNDALSIYNFEIYPSCCELLKCFKIFEELLTKLIEEISRVSNQMWKQDNSTIILSTLSREKTKLRGVLCDMIETRREMLLLKSRVRAAVLF